MLLSDIQRRYANGDLSKAEYISEMYSKHRYLGELRNLMRLRDIKSICVTDDDLIATFHEDNLKFLVNHFDQRNAVFEVLNFGPYEAEDSNCIFRYLDRCKVFLDIGANLGWYSIKAALRYPSLQVYSSEPIPYLFELLQRNCKLNEVSNVEPLSFGFSNRIGAADFYYSPSLSVAASLQNISERTDVELVRSELITLDDFVSERGVTIDFVKCDVEGAEKLVIEGGFRTISEHKPIVFCELLRKWSAKFGYHPNEVFAIMKSLGYRAFTYANGTPIPIDAVNDETVATNFLFLNASKHL